MNNQNFQTIGTKEEIIKTNKSKIIDSKIGFYDKNEDIAEFTDEENVKNKCPNSFGNIHSKEQLENSFKKDRKNNDDYCIII